MATIGQILDKCAQAGLDVENVNDLEIVFLNADGDDVSYSVKGYDEADDQFVIVVDDVEVNTPDRSDSEPSKTAYVSVEVPEGVEVIVTRTSAPTIEDTDE